MSTETTIKHNTYFEGKVQSLALDTENGKATLGVMLPGEYTFGTSTAEVMTIISGELNVKLPNGVWEYYYPNESFEIAAKQSFQVNCEKDVAYICYYE
jgi:uncharacterized protein YaiE (UPF0345 family)